MNRKIVMCDKCLSGYFEDSIHVCKVYVYEKEERLSHRFVRFGEGFLTSCDDCGIEVYRKQRQPRAVCRECHLSKQYVYQNTKYRLKHGKKRVYKKAPK
jgi:hypothetical protein